LSVSAATENAARNGVSLAVRRLDLRTEDVPYADTVAANLIGPLLMLWASAMREAPRRVIASGLLVSEADRVAAAFASHGLAEAARRESGEWAALLLVSDDGG
jgi:ribosomal protein L11 methyltransferase